MKGVVLLGDGELAVRAFDDPKPGRGEVVVRVKTAGICGSDIHLYHQPRKWWEGRPELAAGHEAAGVVESVGEGVTMTHPGDRVSVYHYIGCGKCHHCLAGYRQWCPETKGLGVSAHGGQAELLVVPEDNCYVLPDELSFIDGAFMACAAGTSYSALAKLRPNGMNTLAVFGLGPVGLSGVAVGKAMGAYVVAIGRRACRLGLARDMGADSLVDSDDSDAPSILRGLFPGGVDMAYEASGAPEAQSYMLQILRRGGEACIVAGMNAADGLNAPPIVGKQLTVRGSFVLPLWMVPELAAFLVRHSLAFDRLVTHRFSLDQAQEAYEVFDSGECGKVVFEL